MGKIIKRNTEEGTGILTHFIVNVNIVICCRLYFEFECMIIKKESVMPTRNLIKYEYSQLSYWTLVSND